MNDTLAAIRAELQAESGCHGPEGSAYRPHHGNLHRDDEPAALRSPDDHDGASDQAIRCTQLDLPAAQQRRRVARWVRALPTMQGVRRLWFTARVPQEARGSVVRCRRAGAPGAALSSDAQDAARLKPDEPLPAS